MLPMSRSTTPKDNFRQEAQTRRRRPELQGLRGFAVLAVICFHAGLSTPSGYVGVDSFFVLSGFVIARSIMGSDGYSARSFYLQRCRRLLPALCVILLVTFGLSLLMLTNLGEQQNVARVGVAALLLVANAELYVQPAGYFDPASYEMPLLHLWSLSVEAQFYLVAPALALLVVVLLRVQARWTRWLVAALVTVVVVGSLALFVGLYRNAFPMLKISDPPGFAFFAPVSRGWAFFLGAVVASLPQPRRFLSGRLATTVAGAAMTGLVAATFLPETRPAYEASILACSATGLLLAALEKPSLPSRVLAAAPLRRLGDISYDLYLWHWPLLVVSQAAHAPSIVRTPLCLICATGLSVLTYRMFEGPRRSGRRPGLKGVSLLAGVACTVAAALMLQTGANSGWGRSENVQFMKDRLRLPTAVEAGCLANGMLPTNHTRSCVWRPYGPPKGRVVLLGDSHASSLSDGVIAATRALGYELEIFSAVGCSFPGAIYAGYASVDPVCATQVAAAVDSMRARHADIVLLSQYSVAAVGSLGASGAVDPVRAWQEQLVHFHNYAQQFASAVIHVLDVPEISHGRSAPCSATLTLRLQCRVDRQIVEARQGGIWAAESAAAELTPASESLDLSDVFCRARFCSATQGGRLLYFDKDHLNSLGAIGLQFKLRQALEAATSRPAPTLW